MVYQKIHETRSSEYISWMNMKQRCYNPNNKHFKNYGSRGITISKRWLDSPENFCIDMGKKPFYKAEIDRIDNNKGYYKENCRWISSAENNRNRRDTVLNWFTVRSIRRVYALQKFTRNELALIYNLKITTLNSVVYNQNWKEI